MKCCQCLALSTLMLKRKRATQISLPQPLQLSRVQHFLAAVPLLVVSLHGFASPMKRLVKRRSNGGHSSVYTTPSFCRRENRYRFRHVVLVTRITPAISWWSALNFVSRIQVHCHGWRASAQFRHNKRIKVPVDWQCHSPNGS